MIDIRRREVIQVYTWYRTKNKTKIPTKDIYYWSLKSDFGLNSSHRNSLNCYWSTKWCRLHQNQLIVTVQTCNDRHFSSKKPLKRKPRIPTLQSKQNLILELHVIFSSEAHLALVIRRQNWHEVYSKYLKPTVVLRQIVIMIICSRVTGITFRVKLNP